MIMITITDVRDEGIDKDDEMVTRGPDVDAGDDNEENGGSRRSEC